MESELQQKRTSAYRTASQLVKDQYGDLALGDILESISLSQSLSPEKHADFVNLIGDYILGIYSRSIVEDKLVSEIGMANSDIKGAMSAINNFLTGTKSTPDVPEAPKDLKEKLELRPENTPVVESAPTAEGGVRPLTRDEVLRALAPARTMAGDIASLSTQPPTPQVVPQTPPTPAA